MSKYSDSLNLYLSGEVNAAPQPVHPEIQETTEQPSKFSRSLDAFLSNEQIQPEPVQQLPQPAPAVSTGSFFSTANQLAPTSEGARPSVTGSQLAGLMEVPEAALDGSEKTGFIETFKKETTEGLLSKIPILGATKGISDATKTIAASKRLSSDFDYEATQPSKLQRDLFATGTEQERSSFIEQRLRRQQSGLELSKKTDEAIIGEAFKKANEEFTFGGKVAKGISILPTWMLEFAATGGLASLGDDVARKAGEKVLGRYVKTKAGKIALKTAGLTAGAVVRSSTGLIPRVVEKATDRQALVEIGLKGEEGWATSFAKAWGDTAIESFSEETGGAITKGLGSVAKRLPFGKKFVGLLQKSWMSKTGGTADDFTKLTLKKLGYSNILGEVGEERLGTILREATGVSDREGKIHTRIWEGIKEDFQPENLGVEALVLAVPGLAGKTISLLSKQEADTDGFRTIELDSTQAAMDAGKQVADQAEQDGFDVEIKTDGNKLSVRELTSEETGQIESKQAVTEETKPEPTIESQTPKTPQIEAQEAKALDIAQKLSDKYNKTVWVQNGKVLLKQPEGEFTEVKPVIEAKKPDATPDVAKATPDVALPEKPAQVQGEAGEVKQLEPIDLAGGEFGGTIIHPSARTEGKTQVTNFTEEGKPAGHQEFDTLEDALVDNVKDIEDDVFRPLKNAKTRSKMVKAWEKARFDSPLSSDVKDKKFAYVSPLRPLNGVSNLEGTVVDIERQGVLFRDTPLNATQVKHLSLVPITPEAQRASVGDYIKENKLSQPAQAQEAKPSQAQGEAGEVVVRIKNLSKEIETLVESGKEVPRNLRDQRRQLVDNLVELNPLNQTANTLKKGDVITEDDGTIFTVFSVEPSGRKGDVLVSGTWGNGKNQGFRGSDMQWTFFSETEATSISTGKRVKVPAAIIIRDGKSISQPTQAQEAKPAQAKPEVKKAVAPVPEAMSSKKAFKAYTENLANATEQEVVEAMLEDGIVPPIAVLKRNPEAKGVQDAIESVKVKKKVFVAKPKHKKFAEKAARVKAKAKKPKKAVTQPPIAPTGQPTSKSREKALEKFQATDIKRKRGVSKSVNEAAVNKGLESFFEDIPEYDKADFKSQAKEATKIINTDEYQSYRIAMGQEAAPKGVIPEMVLATVVNRAIEEGDVDTLREVGLTSNLIEEGTVMGRRIRAHGEIDKGSPIKAMAKVVKVREEAYTKKHKKKKLTAEKKKQVKKIKESIKKARPKNGAKALRDFITALQC